MHVLVGSSDASGEDLQHETHASSLLAWRCMYSLHYHWLVNFEQAFQDVTRIWVAVDLSILHPVLKAALRQLGLGVASKLVCLQLSGIWVCNTKREEDRARVLGLVPYHGVGLG